MGAASCAGWILAGNTAGFAACSDNTPSTRDAVPCDSSAPNPDGACVVGGAGVTDVEATVDAGNAVTSPGTIDSVAIHSRGTRLSVDNSGTVSITDGFAAVGAHIYLGALKAGGDRQEVANSYGVHPEDVSRLLPLALLSPRIREAFLTGQQPVELTARYLRPDIELPIIWAALYQMLGV